MVVRSLKVLMIGLMVLSLGVLAYADGQPKQPAAAQPKPTAQRGSLFVDVPSDHYAASDLKFLVERGIITGLPNGEFQGGKALNRYDAAVLIARTLRYVQNDPEKLQPGDLKILQDLIFKVSERVQALDKLEQEMVILKNRPVNNNAESVAEVAALKTQLSQSEAQIVNLQTQVQALRSELQQARAASSAGVIPEEMERLRQQAQTSLLVASFAALAGVVAVIWAIVT